MRTSALKSDALLLLAALIWGFAFVAQRVGMQYVGPFTFNAVRFALGALALVPFLVVGRNRERGDRTARPRASNRRVILGGMLAGAVLFLGASLQQVGIVYTTAGKAGFITGLYVIIVPILGLLWRERPGVGTWVGALAAASGLYLLSVTEGLSLAPGDSLVLAGAFFWAAHVLIVGQLVWRIGPIRLAFLQFVVCSVLSFVAAVLVETISMGGIVAAAIPILYGGVLSVGLAYTLQVFAQQEAPPAHAAIILSLETVFAGFGGWLILQEILTPRALWGCALMLAGILLSQLTRRTVPREAIGREAIR